MRPDELASKIRFILDRSPAFESGFGGAVLIANPTAGGFTRHAYERKRHAELEALMARAASLPPRAAPTHLELGLTERPGHAAALARDYFAAVRAAPPAETDEVRKPRLILTAGGDGTSLEVLSALMELPAAEREGYPILRLPFGTGNDGSDGRDLEACLGRLLRPCAASPRTAIRIAPNPAGGKSPCWSFNIVSWGADAFISHMTNRLKTTLPGDSYKLWVDIASVLYDFLWPSRPMKVRAFDEPGAELRSFDRELLLFAVGASGHRQYGSNKPILPGDDNVCAVSQMPLLRKLALKGPLQKGRHAGIPEIEHFAAARLALAYGDRILMQRDGEVTRLDAIDFPLEVDLLADSYRALAAL